MAKACDHIPRQNGHAGVVQLLLEHGAAKDAPQTATGCTPLYQAAQVLRYCTVLPVSTLGTRGGGGSAWDEIGAHSLHCGVRWEQ